MHKNYRVIIPVQYKENYGAADWDGHGVCPQRWKNKCGWEVLVEEFDNRPSQEHLTQIVTSALPLIQRDNNYVKVIPQTAYLVPPGELTIQEKYAHSLMHTYGEDEIPTGPCGESLAEMLQLYGPKPLDENTEGYDNLI